MTQELITSLRISQWYLLGLKSTPTETTTNYSINNDLAPNGNMNKFKGNSNETFTTTKILNLMPMLLIN
jgi:hypothetical protein